jgi:hypothetical protein
MADFVERVNRALRGPCRANDRRVWYLARELANASRSLDRGWQEGSGPTVANQPAKQQETTAGS